MDNYVKTFKEQGYVLVKNFIPADTAEYLFNYLRFSTHALVMANKSKDIVHGDQQVPGSWGSRHGDMAFDALMKMMVPKMEEVTGLELWPTYTYTRLYKTGNSLAKHTDRPSCEISVTVKLDDTGEDGYNWPIWMKDSEYKLDKGDAVVYRGMDLEHWREVCDAPPDWRMGQVFLHYVDKNGPCADFKYDKRTHMTKLFESEL
jgi:hypothetical protein